MQSSNAPVNQAVIRKMKPIALLLTCITLTLSGCAASSKSPASYHGVDLKPVANAEPSKLQSLASRAKSGDKQAQLELGIRFEEGRGVTRDIKKARKLYTKAASDSGGRIWVYSPPVGGSPGRTIPLDTGPKEYGLPEAIKRLEALEKE